MRVRALFFGSLFDADAVKAFRRKLTALQEVLGVLNDAATTHALASTAKRTGLLITPSLSKPLGSCVRRSNRQGVNH